MSPTAGGPPPPPPPAAGWPVAPQVSAPVYAYAGFWRRVAAYLIDFVLITIGLFVIFLVIGIFIGIALLSTGQDNTTNAGLTLAVYLIAIVLNWVYFAGLESSSWQATVGKRAMNLLVTDVYGRRISFGRATGRYFAKILSGFTLLIGYLMIAFTPRKQGLHDMVAGTLVVRRQYLSLLTASPEQIPRQSQPASAQSL
jgi:uncharacterized RDD family membrane protein YckC